MKPARSTDEYYDGIIAGDRVILAQAITMIESDHPAGRPGRDALLGKILPHTGKAMRLGITGVPGVGKSTFIEAFGNLVIDQGRRVAVLTVDPTSHVTGGSILGDKTRMPTLSGNEMAFIRPSASGSAAGGVAGRTRETMLLCEAAGFDVVIIETVGVGQSEIAVANMVDFFLLLMLAGAGDELQGIKKGIIEMADAIVITKSDGDNLRNTMSARAEFQRALHLLPANDGWWKPRVMTCSAITGEGMEAVHAMIREYESTAQSSGRLEGRRQTQMAHWLKESFDQLIRDDLTRLRDLSATRSILEEKVKKNEMPVSVAAGKLLAAYYDAIRDNKPPA